MAGVSIWHGPDPAQFTTRVPQPAFPHGAHGLTPWEINLSGELPRRQFVPHQRISDPIFHFYGMASH